MRDPTLRSVILVAFLSTLAASCGTDPLVPSSGSLTISTTTTGVAADADGYTVQLNSDAPRPIGSTASLDPIELEPGDYVVTLAGVADNCAVTGENPRSVTVSAAGSSSVGFQVSCSVTTGGLRVRIITTGIDPDSNGYVVTGEGVEYKAMEANDERVLKAMTGNRQVLLSGIEPNCHLEGENPRSIAVSEQATVDLTFNLRCDLIRGRILFLSFFNGVNGIYTVMPDGSHLRNLIAENTTNASWSPDGSKIAFRSVVGQNPNNTQLSVMNADGSGRTVLSPVDWLSDPAWSPDGQTIAFYAPGPEAQISLVGVDGGPVRQLTHGSHISGALRWSPDGRRILFARSYNPPSIFTVTADGSREDTLSTPGELEYDLDPQWSRDGGQIAFIRRRYVDDYPVDNLWVMNADGSNPRALIHSTLNGPPNFSWAPDGNALLASGAAIYRIPLDGSGETVFSLLDFWPIWSPDMSRILYMDWVEGQPDIVIANADRSNARRISPVYSYDTSPAWQP
jgi:Tol biopolymer transport system component